MTLYQSDISIIEKETKSIAKLMDQEERQWFQFQKEITKQKLAQKQAQAYHSKQRAVVKSFLRNVNYLLGHLLQLKKSNLP